MIKQTFNFEKDYSDVYYTPYGHLCSDGIRLQLSFCGKELRRVFGINKKRKRFTMTISDHRMRGAKLIRLNYSVLGPVRWSNKSHDGIFGYDVDQFLINDLKRPKQLYVAVV